MARFDRWPAIARAMGVASRFQAGLTDFTQRRRARLPLIWRPDPPLRRWELSSFRPRVQKSHEPYVRYLVAALRNRTDTAPRNIALSAGYGLGKSSVMRGVVRAFPGRVVNVTLGPLKRGIGPASAKDDPEETAREVRYIQREVVKQLLYSAKQASLPRSRFRRLDRFRLRIVGPIVVPVVGILLLLVYNNNLAARLELLIDQAGIPVWGAYLIAWLGLTVAVVVVVSRLGVVVRVGKVTAGSNSIELTGDDKGSDFFDRYLDEIVYFFQRTKRDIVVFEDIDRFGNADVFEELRELNTLLNQASQIPRRPIRFVYSVRDSLFDEWPADSDGSLPMSLRRATQRMKFFDLVVPMVPTITHRTARDVLKRFRETYPEEVVSDEMLQEVARNVPDMRVLTGILNEFKVFRTITTGADRPELDPNESFALLVYKVHEAADFELVQFNESKLDKLFDHAEAIVQARASELGVALAQWDPGAEKLRTDEQFAFAAHTRLMSAIGEELAFSSVLEPLAWSIDGIPQTDPATTSPAFWKALLDPGAIEVQISSPSTGRRWSVPVANLLAYGGVSASTWGEDAIRAATQRHEALVADQKVFARATWAELYGRDDLAHNGFTFAQKVGAEFQDPIVPRLIQMGHLTDNFYLHSSLFYGQYLGNRATTYLHKYINRRQVSMDFLLDDAREVLALLDLLGDEFLKHQDTALNVSIANAVVGGSRANLIYERFRDPSDLEVEFAQSYLESGQRAEEFLSGIAPIWPGAIDFAVRAGSDEIIARNARVATVLLAADPTLDYRVDADRLVVLRSVVQGLPLLRQTPQPGEATRVAAVLARTGVEIDDLGQIEDSYRDAVRDTGRFALTYENLALVGNGTIALDAFLDHEAVLLQVESQVDEYLRIAESRGLQTVDDPAKFESVMVRFEGVDQRALEALAASAKAEARLDGLDELASSAWAPMLRARRIDATQKVVDDYLDEFGADATILDFLASSISLDPGEVAQANRRAFALKLLGFAEIPVSDRVRLLKSLRMDKYLPVGSIGVDDVELPGALVAANLIQVSAVTLIWAQAGGIEALRGALRASPKFADHLEAVPISASELELIFDEGQGVPEQLRLALQKSLEIHAPNMSPAGWALYASWAARAGAEVSDATLLSLPGLGASTADVVQILIKSFSSRASPVVTELLSNLGGKFARLALVGSGSETFDPSQQIATLAGLVVDRGLARSWRTTLTGKVQIYRRQK